MPGGNEARFTFHILSELLWKVQEEGRRAWMSLAIPSNWRCWGNKEVFLVCSEKWTDSHVEANTTFQLMMQWRQKGLVNCKPAQTERLYWSGKQERCQTRCPHTHPWGKRVPGGGGGVSPTLPFSPESSLLSVLSLSTNSNGGGGSGEIKNNQENITGAQFSYPTLQLNASNRGG